jgi:hypothetical protein
MLPQFAVGFARELFWSRRCRDSRHHGQLEKNPIYDHQPRAAEATSGAGRLT